jgi:hypothetical protein
MKVFVAIVMVLALCSCGSQSHSSQDDYYASRLENWVQRQENKHAQRTQKKHTAKFDVRDFAMNLNKANTETDPAKRADYLVSTLESVPKMKPAARKEFDYEIESAFYSLRNVALDFGVMQNPAKEEILSTKMMNLARKIWGADSRMMIVAMQVRADSLKNAKKDAERTQVLGKAVELSTHYKL